MRKKVHGKHHGAVFVNILAVFALIFETKKKSWFGQMGGSQTPKQLKAPHSWVTRGSSMLTEIILVLLGV